MYVGRTTKTHALSVCHTPQHFFTRSHVRKFDSYTSDLLFCLTCLKKYENRKFGSCLALFNIPNLCFVTICRRGSRILKWGVIFFNVTEKRHQWNQILFNYLRDKKKKRGGLGKGGGWGVKIHPLRLPWIRPWHEVSCSCFLAQLVRPVPFLLGADWFNRFTRMVILIWNEGHSLDSMYSHLAPNLFIKNAGNRHYRELTFQIFPRGTFPRTPLVNVTRPAILQPWHRLCIGEKKLNRNHRHVYLYTFILRCMHANSFQMVAPCALLFSFDTFKECFNQKVRCSNLKIRTEQELQVFLT